MERKTYESSFTYKAKIYPLSISIYFPYKDGYCWRIMIGNYYAGDIARRPDGTWYNLYDKPNHDNLPFPLEHRHYQRLGNIIMSEFPELFQGK